MLPDRWTPVNLRGVLEPFLGVQRGNDGSSFTRARSGMGVKRLLRSSKFAPGSNLPEVSETGHPRLTKIGCAVQFLLEPGLDGGSTLEKYKSSVSEPS